MPNPADKLKLARRHLERVQAAWDTPTDWDDLSIYGLYCLEAAVEAAAAHVGLMTSKKHWEKADIAGELHKKHGLPDVGQLLRDLNDARKAAKPGCRGRCLRDRAIRGCCGTASGRETLTMMEKSFPWAVRR